MTEQEIKEALSQCFDAVDKDGSGALDSSEILEVLKQYNDCECCSKKKDAATLETDVAEFIKEVDKNTDSKVSKEEFLSYFISVLQC